MNSEKNTRLTLNCLLYIAKKINAHFLRTSTRRVRYFNKRNLRGSGMIERLEIQKLSIALEANISFAILLADTYDHEAPRNS